MFFLFVFDMIPNYHILEYESGMAQIINIPIPIFGDKEQSGKEQNRCSIITLHLPGCSSPSTSNVLKNL